MLTPEPTGGVVWNANRGAITLRATMRGKPAHVGRQFEGVNAFERSLAAVRPNLAAAYPTTPRFTFTVRHSESLTKLLADLLAAQVSTLGRTGRIEVLLNLLDFPLFRVIAPLPAA
jgi:hypothetical protein